VTRLSGEVAKVGEVTKLCDQNTVLDEKIDVIFRFDFRHNKEC